MRVAVFSAKPYDRESLGQVNQQFGHELVFLDAPLRPETSALARGYPAVCLFVQDRVDAQVADRLVSGGTRLIALRSAGFNHIDLVAAANVGLTVARVPAYSPATVAEHAVALILALDRRTHRAYARVREGNFSLQGLCGFELHGKSVGIVGTGKIGLAFARIMRGFGCRLFAADPEPAGEADALGVQYVALPELLAQSDIISLHCPLTAQTQHLIDHDALQRMKDGVMLINTGRGALIDARAAIGALKSGKLGFLGLDVYEEEEGLFFEDLSEHVIQDDVLMRLLTFPNVLITAHQGFFTREALHNIAETTLANISAFESGHGTIHTVAVS